MHKGPASVTRLFHCSLCPTVTVHCSTPSVRPYCINCGAGDHLLPYADARTAAARRATLDNASDATQGQPAVCAQAIVHQPPASILAGSDPTRTTVKPNAPQASQRRSARTGTGGAFTS